MASDFLLEVDGIRGESKDAQHPGTIELESFSWGATNPDTGLTGSKERTRGRVQIEPINFTSSVNKASGELMRACWAGTNIKKASLYVRKQGEKQQDYYVVRMENVIVTAYHSGASNGSLLPADSFSFSFTQVKFEYKAQKPDGSLEAPVTVGYDTLKAQTT